MLKLYNTLSRSIETFTPRNAKEVTMYSCGPTVYDYQHIGHLRRYVGDDVLVRVLRMNGYRINRVMNITDVGHLVSDSDEGEDKMEKGARKFGKSVWDIAKMFEQQFIESCERLLIEKPTLLMHATDYIPQQIALIKVLEEKGFTYQIADGIYFNTSKFPEYTKLSRQKEDELRAGARVEMTEGKKHATDFALWKFSYPYDRSFDFAQAIGSEALARRDDVLKKRQMEWESPWGIGFPGWHIECSAMSLEGLFHAFDPFGKLRVDRVNTVDIHSGGIDHIAIHHTNEIAQAEAATGRQFVEYWVHHNFLQVNGEKMSKSLGNFYTVQDVIDKGFDPMALRYLYLQTHYRQEMNFTWESLEAAEKGLHRLRSEISNFNPSVIASEEKQSRENSHQIAASSLTPRNDVMRKFAEAVNDDMNMAKSLAVVWEVVKADISEEEKVASLVEMDNVLGLELFKNNEKQTITRKFTITYTLIEERELPEGLLELAFERLQKKLEKDYKAADILRARIKELGYLLKDNKDGCEIEKIINKNE